MQNKSTKEPSRSEIWKMFDGLANTYDKANRIMTLCMDVYWRRQVCSHFPKKANLALLDLATGTGDQIISAFKNHQNLGFVAGIDLAEEMLDKAKNKIKYPVELRNGSALDIPYPQETFDCATMSFGIRNVVDVDLCLREIVRVLKPGGRALILEGTVPENRFLRAFHLFYLRHFLPRIGGWISKNRSAYVYLNKTIETFPSGKAFCAKMHTAGFSKAKAIPLTGGIATLYQGEK